MGNVREKGVKIQDAMKYAVGQSYTRYDFPLFQISFSSWEEIKNMKENVPFRYYFRLPGSIERDIITANKPCGVMSS